MMRHARKRKRARYGTTTEGSADAWSGLRGAIGTIVTPFSSSCASSAGCRHDRYPARAAATARAAASAAAVARSGELGDPDGTDGRRPDARRFPEGGDVAPAGRGIALGVCARLHG